MISSMRKACLTDLWTAEHELTTAWAARVRRELRLDVEDCVEADGEAAMVSDSLAAQEHAGRER